MNLMERQMQLGRDLMELNSEWFRKIAEFDAENLNKYVSLNQDFATRLTEVRDMQGFMDLQREYGEQLWNGTQEALQSRGEMLQQVADANGELMRNAFTPAEEKPKARKAKAA